MDRIPELPEAIRPFVQQGVRVTREEDSLSFVTQREIYQVAREDAQKLWRVLPFLDGRQTLTEVALASGLDLDEVRAAVEPLYCAALLGERTDEPVSAVMFYEHVRNCGPIWQGLSSWRDPLPELIESGRADGKLVLGILTEEWHYVASNPVHASTAVLNA